MQTNNWSCFLMQICHPFQKKVRDKKQIYAGSKAKRSESKRTLIPLVFLKKSRCKPKIWKRMQLLLWRKKIHSWLRTPLGINWRLSGTFWSICKNYISTLKNVIISRIPNFTFRKWNKLNFIFETAIIFLGFLNFFVSPNFRFFISLWFSDWKYLTLDILQYNYEISSKEAWIIQWCANFPKFCSCNAFLRRPTHIFVFP